MDKFQCCIMGEETTNSSNIDKSKGAALVFFQDLNQQTSLTQCSKLSTQTTRGNGHGMLGSLRANSKSK